MNLKFLGIPFITLALAACSTQPTQPAARAPAPPVAQAPAAAPSTPAAATPVALLPNSNGQALVLNRTLIQAGYKATSVKGEIYYCREEQVTGTSFKRKVCLTEAQLKDQERKVKELQDRMMRQQANPGCSGSSCG